MAKTHTDTDVGLNIMFTGMASGGRRYIAEPKDGAGIEARKRRFLEDFEVLLRRHVLPHADGEFSQSPVFKREFSCSHCLAPWTEQSETYNGGCCEGDEANNPESVAA